MEQVHPWDFLAQVPMPRTNKDMRRRREIVVRFLNKSYNFSTQNCDEALEECRRQGLRATKKNLQNDASIFRMAFRFLNAPPEEQEQIRHRTLTRKSIGFRGIRCLIAAGITGWDQLKPPVPPVIDETETPAPATEKPGWQPEWRGEPEEPREEEEVVVVSPQTLAELNQLYNSIANILQELLVENEVLERRVSRQEFQVTELRARVERIKMTRLNELAEYFPEAPRLYALVQAIEQERYTAREIPEDLPRQTKTGNSVAYAKAFLKTLRAAEEELRAQTIKALGHLAEQGADYPGLNIEPYTGSRVVIPNGAKTFTCRVSHEWRLLWYRTNGTLRIHGLYHHTGLYKSEA